MSLNFVLIVFIDLKYTKGLSFYNNRSTKLIITFQITNQLLIDNTNDLLPLFVLKHTRSHTHANSPRLHSEGASVTITGVSGCNWQRYKQIIRGFVDDMNWQSLLACLLLAPGKCGKLKFESFVQSQAEWR